MCGRIKIGKIFNFYMNARFFFLWVWGESENGFGTAKDRNVKIMINRNSGIQRLTNLYIAANHKYRRTSIEKEESKYE